MVKRLSQAFLLMLFMVLISLPAMAADEHHDPTPASLSGVTVVDDAWVKDNYKKMKVYDVRKKAEYVEGHIAGAISVPYGEKSDKVVNFDASKDTFDTKAFPSDKNESFILYCNGPMCWKSYKAAVLLLKEGHKKMYWYRNDGFPSWKSKGYPVE